MGALSPLNVGDLEIFVRCARARSIRELARQLRLNPAHVSKALQRLERQVGQKLLRRSASGVLLTPEGLQALKAAEGICGLADRLDPRRSERAEGARAWSVGSTSVLTVHLLAPLADALAGSGRLRLIECTPQEIVSHGLSGAFEIAVHLDGLQWTRAWVSRPAGPVRFQLFGRSGHPLGTETTPDRLGSVRFVTPVYLTAQGFLPGLDHCPLPLRQRLIGHETSTADAAVEVVRRSDHLAFLPEIAARRLVRSGELQEIRVRKWPEVRRELLVSVRADLVPLPLFRGFCETLRRELA